MKIRLVSDLHLEIASIDLAPAGEDLIIFAGDIGIHTTGMAVANKVARTFDVPVIYIATSIIAIAIWASSIIPGKAHRKI
jgi:hypothetical protein